MVRLLAVALLFTLAAPGLAADKPTVKVEDTPPPKDLAEPVRTLLSKWMRSLLFDSPLR